MLATAPRVVAQRPVGTARVAFVSLIGFVIIVYANPGQWMDGVEEIGFAKIAAAFSLLALAGSWLLYNRPLNIGGAVGVLLLCLFAWVGFSALWSFYPAMTFSTFTDGLKYLAVFFLVANVIDSETRFARLVAWLAWISAIPAIACIVSYARGLHLVEGDRASWVGIFANPNDLAYHLTVGTALALAAREATTSERRRIGYLGLIGLFAFTVLLTKSRGGMLSISTVLLLWSLRSFRRARSLVGVALIIGCVLSIGPGGGPGGGLRGLSVFRARNERSMAFGQDLSARGRVDAWRTGMKIVAERPLLGVGAGAFMVAWPTFSPGDAGAPRTEHNTFVQLVSELGITGLGLFVAALVCAFVNVTRGGSRRLSPQLRGVQVGLAGFGVSSLTGGLAFSWPFYLLLGLSVAAARLRRTRRGAT